MNPPPAGEGDHPQGGGGVDHLACRRHASEAGHPSTTGFAGGPPPLAGEDLISAHCIAIAPRCPMFPPLSA